MSLETVKCPDCGGILGEAQYSCASCARYALGGVDPEPAETRGEV